jgi:hypothetical protein
MNAPAFATRNAAIVIPPSDQQRHSLAIVRRELEAHDDLESILSTAERRGLTKIANAIRTKIMERDLAMLERASMMVGTDESLGQAFIQFGIREGVLVCRAFIDQEQEEHLIALLSTIEGPRRIDLEVLA